MKFKFETGEVIDCFDMAIAELLRMDKRYKEVKDDAPKGKGKKAEEVKDETPKGDDLNGEVQE
jgi:hypothetical protein